MATSSKVLACLLVIMVLVSASARPLKTAKEDLEFNLDEVNLEQVLAEEARSNSLEDLMNGEENQASYQPYFHRDRAELQNSVRAFVRKALLQELKEEVVEEEMAEYQPIDYVSKELQAYLQRVALHDFDEEEQNLLRSSAKRLNARLQNSYTAY